MPLEIISAYDNDNAGVLQRLTMFGEDSNVVRSGTGNGDIYLLDAWVPGVGEPGVCNIRSPRMHDNVNGIQIPLTGGPASQLPLFPNFQKFISQDSLNLFITTVIAPTGYANLHLLIYYEDLPESPGKYITHETLLSNKNQIMTLEHEITPTSHVDYSGGLVITDIQDSFRSLESYAFLGFKFIDPVDNTAMCLRGHDTGNLRIGQPMSLFTGSQKDFYFTDLAKKSGLPVIPVINAANKDNTFIDAAAGETLAKITFYSYWELLTA